MASTEFINVDALILPTQQLPLNPNNIALATTDVALLGVADYTIHQSLKGVGDTYGTSSDTYAFANAVFSQQPNILTGNGSLTIIPFAGVNATKSIISTGDLTDNVPNFKTISDGKILITIDGTAYNVNGLNFTNVTTVSDIASVIYKKIPKSIILVEEAGGVLTFSSLKYGVNSTITIAVSALSGTDLMGGLFLGSATFASVTTIDLSVNLANIIATTDGIIKITINGVDYDIDGLNFTTAITVLDLVNIFYTKIPSTVVKIEAVGDTLKFSSLINGTASGVVITAGTLVGTDLTGATLFDIANIISNSPGTETAFLPVPTVAVNASGETVVEAFTRILALPEEERPDFHAVATTLRFEFEYAVGSYLQTTGAYFNGLDKIFVHAYSALSHTTDALAVKNATLNDIRIVYHKASEALTHVGGIMGLLFSNNVSFINASGTLNKKAIVGSTPVLYLTDTDKVNLKNAGVDYYISDLGNPAYVSLGANGGFFDDRYNRLIITLEGLKTYNNALTSLTKIPQTQKELNAIGSKVRETLVRFRSNGIIGAGIKWNSNTRPNKITAESFDRAIFDDGFYIDVPLITDQSQIDREERKSPQFPIYVQFAGAIHTLSSVIFIQR